MFFVFFPIKPSNEELKPSNEDLKPRSPQYKKKKKKKKKNCPIEVTRSWSPSLFSLAILAHSMGQLLLRDQGTHLVVVALRRIELPHRPDVVGRVAGNADVPVPLQDDLDVLDIERVRTSELSHLAGGGGNGVDEFVDELQD